MQRNEKIAHYSLYIILGVLTLLVIWMLLPYWTYLFFAGLLTVAFYPVNKFIARIIKNDYLRACIMLAIVLFLIIVPSIYITTTLVKQSQGIFVNFRDDVYQEKIRSLPFIKNQTEDLQNWLIDEQLKLKHSIADSATDILSSITDFIIGLFVMFFTMFYFFKDGRRLYYYTLKRVPLKPDFKKNIVRELRSIINAVLYGQILTAIAQGVVGAIIFFSFGIPNTAFWGFLMIIAAFIPYFGTFVIWGPATVWMVFSETSTYSPTAIIVFFVLNALIVGNIDNLLRPYLIGRKSQLHTGIALLGVLGGLKAFGIAGIIVGPILFAMLIVLGRFLLLDSKKKTSVPRADAKVQ